MIHSWLILALAAPALAGGPGTSVAPLFKFNWGARPAAMGGAFVAAADDVNATLWNPGGLAFVRQPVVGANHASLYSGVIFDELSAAAPLGRRGGIGGHFAYMNSGPIDRTLEDPGGSFDAVNSGGQFRDSQFKLNLSGGGAPFEWLGVGGGLNYFRDSVDQNSADGVMMDLGAMVKGGLLTYGVSLQNCGPQVRGLDTLPTTLRVGVAARPNEEFLLMFEYDHRLDSYENVFALGAEYYLGSAFALRLGMLRGSGEGSPAFHMTGGFGVSLGSFGFDYGFTPFGELGGVHQVGLSYHFGPERDKRRPSAPEPPQTKKPDAEVTPEEHFLRADMMLASKLYPKAREELTAALAMLAAEDRRRIRYFDRMGEMALADNDLDSAQVFFNDGLRLGSSLGLSDPDVGDVYAGMGLTLAAKGNVPLAIRFLEKAIEFGTSIRRKGAAVDKLKELKKLKR